MCSVLGCSWLLCRHTQGVFEYLQAQGIKAPEAVGLQVMVHGVVPLGARQGMYRSSRTALPMLACRAELTRPETCSSATPLLGSSPKADLHVQQQLYTLYKSDTLCSRHTMP